MKTIRIIFTIIVSSTLLFTGCSLDEENPTGGATLQEQISTKDGFEKYVNACYYPLSRTWTGGGEDYVVFQAEAGTDLWTCPLNDSWLKDVIYYSSLNASSSSLGEGWQSCYEGINDCNTVIYYASDVTGYNSAEDLDAKTAEAYFLRAFYNFFIVEQWGGKFLTTVPTETATTEVPLSPVSSFYNLIFSDLKYAMKYLPNKQDETGRPTRAAAYHLYAKACLQYAEYDDVKNKTELYKEAKDAALEVIDNASKYGLSLYKEPGSIFVDANNKNNSEAIWVATHSSNSSLNPRGSKYWNRVYKQFLALGIDGSCGVAWDINTENVKGERRIMPTKWLLSLYGQNDLRYKAFFHDVFYASKDYTWSAADAIRYLKDSSAFVGKKTIASGDTAMYFTREELGDAKSKNYACFDMNLLYDKETGETNYNNAQYGYVGLKKFEAPGMYAGATKKSYTYADQIIYRLADTYLLAGEAYYRLGESNKAVPYFNDVRNRACKNHDGSMNIEASDINVDFILQERARELCGEYTRWMDLKRMGKSKMTEYVLKNPDIKARGYFNYDIHKVRPVPDKKEGYYATNADEVQNEGY